jgi:hypothetical protein
MLNNLLDLLFKLLALFIILTFASAGGITPWMMCLAIAAVFHKLF